MSEITNVPSWLVSVLLIGAVFPATAGEVVHGLDVGFPGSGSTTNITVRPTHLELAFVSDLNVFGTTSDGVEFFREEDVTFANFDNHDPLRAHADYVPDAWPFGKVHECLDPTSTRSSGVFSDDDTFYFGGQMDYRVGPVFSPLAEYAPTSGTSIVGPNANATGLAEVWFLTTGSHHCDGIGTETATYTVFVDYQGGGDRTLYIDVPLDRDAYSFPEIIDSSSGDQICDASDDWCVYATGDAEGAFCQCGSDDICNLFEIVAFIDDAREVDELSVSWANEYDSAVCDGGDDSEFGLEGPSAVSMVTTSDLYAETFENRGSFDTFTNTIGAPVTALWYQVDWIANLDQEQEGFRFTDFSCGATGNEAPSSGWSGLPWMASDGPVIPTDDVAGVEPSDVCQGRYLTYRAEFIDGADSSWRAGLSEVTFSYDLDADQDGFGEAGLATMIKDCYDDDPLVSQITWWADCDGEGYTGWNFCLDNTACTPQEARFSCLDPCIDGALLIWEAGLGSDGDCDDEDFGIGNSILWYADCDGDTFTDDATTCNSCDPDTDCNTACGGFPPLGGWKIVNDDDCDDNDSGANQLDCVGVCGGLDTECEIFPDGFESGDTTAWSATVS